MNNKDVDIYRFGECVYCHKPRALKNGKCSACSVIDMPDFLKDIFNDKEKRNEEM